MAMLSGESWEKLALSLSFPFGLQVLPSYTVISKADSHVYVLCV